MAERKDAMLPLGYRDPFALLRQMTAELDRAFDDSFWPGVRGPALRGAAASDRPFWAPKVDVFEKDGRLVTRVDLPGVKKEDVSVEATDGHLTLSGERRHEREEKKDQVYRTEREYGSFHRTIPLPEGVKLDDVKATFADGVLEVSVPVPSRVEAAPRKVQIEGPPSSTGGKAAA